MPAGTCLISDTLYWKRWVTLRGSGRTRTTIKLVDNAAGYGAGAHKPVLRTYYSNNESFGNYIEDLTIDTGKGNPGAIGLRWNNHNEGALRNLMIRAGDGNGEIGLDMTETEFGPGLVKDVSIEGFDKGVVTVGSVSHATFENISLLHQHVVGFENSLPISILGLYSNNSVPVLKNNDFILAHAMIVNAKLEGGSPDQSAIDNAGGLHLRNIETLGYARALRDHGADQPGATIDEYITDERLATTDTSTQKPLRLSLEAPPQALVEPVSKWVQPKVTGDDATDAIQAAFDSGGATVFFQFYADQDYSVRRTVRVPATVKRIVGLHSGPSSRFGNYEDHIAPETPVLRIEGDTDEPLVIESFFAGRWPYEVERPGIEIASNRPVYLKSCGGGYLSLPAGYHGKVWLEDTHVDIRIQGTQQVRAVHYNPENNAWKVGRTYVRNAGGSFVCLGMKTEAIALHVATSAGGKTELLGGFFRDHEVLDGDAVPYFTTEDSWLTATYFEYDWGGGHARGLQAIETNGGKAREVRLSRDSHRVGLLAIQP